MSTKALSVLALHLAGVWAQVSISACLDPSVSGAPNKAACCAGTGTGRAQVDGVLYEYTCNSYANNFGTSSHAAKNAHACAQICLQDPKCHASSWQPDSGGRCWLSSEGFQLTEDKYKLWVILVNTERAGHVIPGLPEPEITPPAEQNCDDEIKRVKDECDAEKAQHDQGCQEKIKHEVDTCQTTAQTKCDSEKALLEQSIKAQCTKELNDCEAGHAQCKAENEKLKKQLADAQKKPVSPPPTPNSLSTSNCPTSNGAVVSYGGRNWKITCQRSWNGRDATGRNRGAMTRDACVDVCAKDGACKFSHYSTSTRVCWTYNQYTGPFNVNWPWDVYMKV